MLDSDSKYTSGVGIGGIATTLVGMLVATGIITPEQGSILSLNIVPIVGGLIAVIGAFTVYATPHDIKAPPMIVTKVPDTSKKDPFNNR